MKTYNTVVINYDTYEFHKYIKILPELNDPPGIRYTEPGRCHHICVSKDGSPHVEWNVPEPCTDDSSSVEGGMDYLPNFPQGEPGV